MQHRIIPLAIVAAFVAAPAFVPVPHAQNRTDTVGTAGINTDAAKDARETLMEAQKIAKQMRAQPDVKRLLDQSKGVFLVPNYGRAALVVGGSGGEGVLLGRMNGQWTDPVFYNLGSFSVGAQAGVTAGQLAMIVMTDKALNSFKGENTFSLNANAGLTIVDWSARGQASLGKADVVLYSDTEGAFAGASFSASDISADSEENQAYYDRRDVGPGAILSGQVKQSTPEAKTLKESL